MKRLILLLIASVLMLSLVGCTLPREGSFEHFTVVDVFSYVFKLAFGPIFKEVPKGLSSDSIPDEHSEDTTSIAFTLIGDIMFTENIQNDLYRAYPEKLKESDLTIANLEFPINPLKGPSGFPHFNGTTEFFERAVLPLHPDILNVANNHCLDQGTEGLYTTMELLKRYKILFTGIKLNSKQYIVLELKAVKIALTGFTYSTNALKDAGDEIVNKLRLNRPCHIEEEIVPLISLVQEMKEKADIVIAILHWGFEYEFSPTENQIYIAHKLIETGADMIIGHHPHVLQDFEYYTGENGRKGLIFYSLGNWTTGMNWLYTRTTAVINVRLDKKGNVLSVETYPFIFEDGKFNPLVEFRDNKFLPDSFKIHSAW